MYTVYEYIQHLKDVLDEVPYMEMWTTGLNDSSLVWEGECDDIPTELDDRRVTSVNLFYNEYFERIVIEISII